MADGRAARGAFSARLLPCFPPPSLSARRGIPPPSCRPPLPISPPASARLVGRSVCLPLVLYVFNNLSVCLPLYPSVSFFSLPSPSVISRVPSPISSLPSLPTTLYFPLSPLLYPLSFVQEIVFQLSSCFLSPTIILRKLFFVCHVYVLDV